MSALQAATPAPTEVAVHASVFVHPVMIESRGHILDADSDPKRWSHGTCRCPSGREGWLATYVAGAEELVDQWRGHVSMSPSLVERPWSNPGGMCDGADK